MSHCLTAKTERDTIWVRWPDGELTPVAKTERCNLCLVAFGPLHFLELPKRLTEAHLAGKVTGHKRSILLAIEDLGLVGELQYAVVERGGRKVPVCPCGSDFTILSSGMLCGGAEGAKFFQLECPGCGAAGTVTR